MNQNRVINDPVLRQYQLEKCREELRLYEGYCRARQQFGYPVELPQFNDYGQVINLPPNFRRVPFSSQPQHVSNAQSFHQSPNSNDSFSLCYTLSDDRNSPARQVFEQFRNHPMIPKNMAPKRVVFVYEKPDGGEHSHTFFPHAHHNIGNQQGTQTRSVDASVGDHSVVRYNMETQTEWEDIKQGATDNHEILHNTIKQSDTKAPTTTPNLLSEPETPEFNLAILKVAKWLQMSKDIGDVFTGNGQAQRSTGLNYKHRTIPTQACYQGPRPIPAYKIPCHGSQSSCNLQKLGVPLTIARRHSTVDMKVETKTRSNGGGDDNETTASNTGGDSEKPVETNNEASQLSVAENCSPSIEVQGDIKSAVSHADVDESQTKSESENNQESSSTDRISKLSE